MDSSAAIGLMVIALLIALAVSFLPNKKYTCSKCGYETYDEVMAAGHEKLENTHKIVLG